MRVTKFLQMAVKKGPFARGGLKWKGHGAFRVTQTRKTNAKKRLKYVNENDSVLREAAANDASMTMMRAMMMTAPTKMTKSWNCLSLTLMFLLPSARCLPSATLQAWFLPLE